MTSILFLPRTSIPKLFVIQRWAQQYKTRGSRGEIGGGHALGFIGDSSEGELRITGVGPELKICRKMLKIGSIYICYVRIHLKILVLMSY